MENASKALIMAGGILITILVVSLLVLFWNQVSDYKKTNSKDLELQLSVNDAINKLDEREQFILDERFVIGIPTPNTNAIK